MKIRTHPDDFIVEELLREDVTRRFTPTPSARRHAVYTLTKTSLTTEEAIRRLARKLRVAPGAVSAAGLKDKHAVTTQHVSVAPGAASRPDGVGDDSWRASLIGWSAEPAVAGWIRRNRFPLVVRDLTRAEAERMDRAARALLAGQRLLVVNYFGDQRFGSARHGEGFAGARLARGDFEGALRLLIGTPARKDTGDRRTFTRLLARHWGRWEEALRVLPFGRERSAIEVLATGGDFRAAFAALPTLLRRMAVEAYQSHLWNAVARDLASTLAPGPECLTAPGRHGVMLFPPSSRIGTAWRTLDLPMLAPTTTLVEPWGGVVRGVLRSEGISLADLDVHGVRRPFFGEAWRPFVAFADNFEVGPPEPDDAGAGMRLRRTLRFELPRGAYATVVLRALSAAPGASTPG
jgi:tRNA pseudouridine13 synthase